MQTPSQSEPKAELTPRARDSQLLGSLVGFLIAYFLSPWLSHQLADSLWPVSLILIGIGGAVGFYLGALWYRESSPKSAATTAIGYLLMSTVGGTVLFFFKANQAAWIFAALAIYAISLVYWSFVRRISGTRT